MRTSNPCRQQTLEHVQRFLRVNGHGDNSTSAQSLSLVQECYAIAYALRTIVRCASYARDLLMSYGIYILTRVYHITYYVQVICVCDKSINDIAI